MADVSRRTVLNRLLAIPAGFSLAAKANAQDQFPPSASPGRMLVAYFSRTGNTRVIAGQLRRARQAEMFEILPANPYPEDYEETVRQAQNETEAGFEPNIARTVPDMNFYDTLYLGFPIWGMTAPPVIRSFLSHHDLAGKSVVPFITHGGYGLGRSLSVVGEHAPGARVMDAFSVEADQERRSLEQVTEWLGLQP